MNMQANITEKVEQQVQLPKSDDSQNSSDIGDHLERRKKKKVKRVRKHSPSYYEHLKIVKFNHRREAGWDNRFMNDTIPQNIDHQKKMKRMTSAKKQLRKKNVKQSKRHIETLSVDPKKSKPSKSFNVRVVSRKEQQIKQQTKPQVKKTDERDELFQLLDSLEKETQYAETHKELLKNLIKNSKNTGLKGAIHAQIARIKNKTSCCSLVEQAIQRRQKIISQLKEKNPDISKQMVKEYQLATTAVIEEILRWKETWEENYLKSTKIRIKLNFQVQKRNYFLRIGEDVAFLNETNEQYNDPFLLKLNTEDMSDDVIIRVRACQLLLLEEKLNQY